MGIVGGNIKFVNNTFYRNHGFLFKIFFFILENVAIEYTDFVTAFYMTVEMVDCLFLNETTLSTQTSVFFDIYAYSFASFQRITFQVLHNLTLSLKN